MGQTGHLRASIGGDGWFNARRPNNKSGRHAGIDIAGILNTTSGVAFQSGTISFAGPTTGMGGTIVMISDLLPENWPRIRYDFGSLKGEEQWPRKDSVKQRSSLL
jgi:hypothetical protein